MKPEEDIKLTQATGKRDTTCDSCGGVVYCNGLCQRCFDEEYGDACDGVRCFCQEAYDFHTAEGDIPAEVAKRFPHAIKK